MIKRYNFGRLLLCLLVWALGTQVAVAENSVVVGPYEIHHIIIPTTFLNPEIASQYDLVRGKDRALVNVSVVEISPTTEPSTNTETQSTITAQGVHVSITGSSENLLGQRQALQFKQITEGDAIYYLATLRHADEEYHKVTIDVVLPNNQEHTVAFQQQMFWKH